MTNLRQILKSIVLEAAMKLAGVDKIPTPSSNQTERKKHTSFASKVAVSPEMASLLEKLGAITPVEDIIEGLSPELKEKLSPIVAQVMETHLAQILSDRVEASQKLQQMQLQRSLELEVAILENESLIANIGEQFRLIEQIENLMLSNTPKLKSPMAQALSQVTIYQLVKNHLDSLDVQSDIREKILAPLQKFDMLEALDEPNDNGEDGLGVRIANLQKDDNQVRANDETDVNVIEMEESHG